MGRVIRWLLVATAIAGVSACDAATTPGERARAEPSTSEASIAASTQAVPRCRGDQLRLHLGSVTGVASSDAARVAVVDRGGRCAISGYPRLVAFGRPTRLPRATPRRGVGRVVHGPLHQALDPGPHRLVVPHRGRIWFSVGTISAYSGRRPVEVTGFDVVLPGTSVTRHLEVGLLASRPPGRRVPITTTALVAHVRP